MRTYLLGWLVFFGVHLAIAQISVHKDRPFLQTKSGKPFFWLGDTDWEIFHRLTREEAAALIEIRSAQGFNVLQCVALAEFNGLHQPNRYGDIPLINDDPTKLNITPGDHPDNEKEYDYWDHIDYIIQLAAVKGMYIGLLPTWGDKVAHLWGEGPRIFNETNAYIYARKLAERYKNHWNILWILGGDRPAVYKGNDGKDYDDRAIWSAMAKGIQSVCGDSVFITYHPSGGSNSTSQFIHDEKWLSMNAFQSGHGSRETDAWNWVVRDLSMLPLKPTLDMEPCYEDHPVNPWDGRWTRKRGYFTAYDVRCRIYRDVFAGACGVTYGHHQVWQFMNPRLNEPVNPGDTIIPWQKAVYSEAAGEMKYLKDLMLSRPFFSRIHDESLILSDTGNNYINRVEATRDKDGTYAMIYVPRLQKVKLDLHAIKGHKKQIWYFDVRTGSASKQKVVMGKPTVELDPPSEGKDWVIVVDDASEKFNAPGKIKL